MSTQRRSLMVGSSHSSLSRSLSSLARLSWSALSPSFGDGLDGGACGPRPPPPPLTKRVTSMVAAEAAVEGVEA